MGKPTREGLMQLINARWPGVTIFRANRGLVILVGTADLASEVACLAKSEGLTVPTEPEAVEGEYEVQIFGFPRQPRDLEPAEPQTMWVLSEVYSEDGLVTSAVVLGVYSTEGRGKEAKDIREGNTRALERWTAADNGGMQFDVDAHYTWPLEPFTVDEHYWE